MSKITMMLVNAFAFALVGCGSSGSGNGSTAGSTTTAGGAASASAGLSTVGTTVGGNPGVVPDTILGEVSSVNLSTAAGPAGYKIFAGDVFFLPPDIPADLIALGIENSYVNLEFPCNSELGHIEVIPKPLPGFTPEPYGGTFSWETANAQDNSGVVDLVLETITYGDADIAGALFNIDQIVNGSLIVGTGVIEELFVTRIVQFEVCN